MSEKLDGVRAYWDGKQFLSRQGNLFHAPDWFIDGLAKVTRIFSVAWDRVADRSLVDGFVNLLANWTYSIGLSLRQVQTGRIRQYVMFIVIGAVAIFILISLWNTSSAA